MTTENAETNTSATVGAQGAAVAPEKVSSKKTASPKNGAPKGQKSAKGGKPKAAATAKPKKAPPAKTAAKATKAYKDMFEKKSADAVLDLIEAAIGPWDVIVAPLHFIADHPDAGYDPTARAVGVHACNGTFDYATGRPCTVYINGAPYHPPAQ